MNNMFAKLLSKLEEVRDAIENVEAKTDTQALVLVELSNVLARAASILKALTNDEGDSR